MHIAENLKEKVNSLLQKRHGTLEELLGIEYLSFEPDCIKASMAVNRSNQQPFGLLHGGASVSLAESLASVGAWLNVEDPDTAVVGIEINANHIKAVRSGKIFGEARPLHIGKRTQVWEVHISNEQSELICASRCTLAAVTL